MQWNIYNYMLSVSMFSFFVFDLFKCVTDTA